MSSPPVSRVLSRTTIYLGISLLIHSSGYRPANGPFFNADLLAADRVYLLHMSPYDAVGSYPTHFTLTSFTEVIKAVLFLWHFP